jgi:hypothetical protein
VKTHADKTQENKSQSEANDVTQKKRSNGSTFQFIDNRSEAVTQRKLHDLANNSKTSTQLKKTIQFVKGWNFIGKNQPALDLVRLIFTNATTGQTCFVHHHPGTDFVSAVEIQGGERHDSTKKFDADLEEAALAYLKQNPIPSTAKKAADISLSEPVNEAEAKAKYTELGKKAGSGSYVPPGKR